MTVVRAHADAAIGIHVADPALAAALATAIADAVAAALPPPAEYRIVYLRSRKRLAELGELADAVAMIGVTPRNARHLVALIDGCRRAGAAGIQLVWDGIDRSHERHVFAALEHVRATPAAAPVVLAATTELASALHILIARRR